MKNVSNAEDAGAQQLRRMRGPIARRPVPRRSRSACVARRRLEQSSSSGKNFLKDSISPPKGWQESHDVHSGHLSTLASSSPTSGGFGLIERMACFLLIAAALRHARAGRVELGDQILTSGQFDLVDLDRPGFDACWRVQLCPGIPSRRAQDPIGAPRHDHENPMSANHKIRAERPRSLENRTRPSKTPISGSSHGGWWHGPAPDDPAIATRCGAPD